MTTCNSNIVVAGAGIYTIRKCVYVDANKVSPKDLRFDQVDATLESEWGARGRCKGRGKTSAFGRRSDVVDGGSGGVRCV